MFKKEKHNIPSNYDKVAKKNVETDGSNMVEGIIVSDVKKTGGRGFSKIKKPKFLIFFSVFIVSALAVTGIYLYLNRQTAQDNDHEAYLQQSEQLIAQSEKNNQELVSKPLSDSATESEKTYYYIATLRIKLKEANRQAIADYYLNEVKPKNIPLPLDIQEQLVNPLISTGHTKEAKALLQAIIATYRSTPVADPVLKPYIDDKINQYVAKEKSL